MRSLVECVVPRFQIIPENRIEGRRIDGANETATLGFEKALPNANPYEENTIVVSIWEMVKIKKL